MLGSPEVDNWFLNRQTTFTYCSLEWQDLAAWHFKSLEYSSAMRWYSRLGNGIVCPHLGSIAPPGRRKKGHESTRHQGVVRCGVSYQLRLISELWMTPRLMFTYCSSPLYEVWRAAPNALACCGLQVENDGILKCRKSLLCCS